MSGAPLRVQVPMRWGDMDAYGHVNNVKYIEYAQEARILFIRSRFGPYGLGIACWHFLARLSPNGNRGEWAA